MIHLSIRILQYCNSYSFPSHIAMFFNPLQNGFFNDKYLLLDTHLLDENVHDDERNEREEKRLLFDGVYLEDNEDLVKQLCVEILIESKLVAASLVEVFQQIVVCNTVAIFVRRPSERCCSGKIL